MNKTQHYAEFVADLKLEQNTIKVFIETLQKEQHSLIEGNIADLDFLASEKEKIAEQLTNFSEQRNRYLASQELSTNTEGMRKLLANHAPHTEINLIWNESLQLIKIAHQLSQTNGTIITTRLQHSQRALAALQCAAGTTSLYGPKGQAF
ncbi:MAG: flagellar protein FlgN [Nitrosomonas sp.]|nr:flagellar protein FlgN [Nitrosomonas sp.]MDP1950540.1 flagellar protein FlgN [Nitrosomonas sp.]